MRIMLLNGSPKKEHSDTLHISRALVRGMNAVSDNQVTEIHVAERHLEFCCGCFACKTNGGRCIFDDDMHEILEEMLLCDLVIFSFPLYSYAMPAQIKNLIDRMMPLTSWNIHRDEKGKYGHTAQRDFSKVHYMMVCGCGYPNSKHNFEGAVRQFELKFPEGVIITMPESPMFNIPQAAQFTAPRIAQLEQAGKEYAAGGVTPETMALICSPMIPEEIYARFANGERK